MAKFRLSRRLKYCLTHVDALSPIVMMASQAISFIIVVSVVAAIGNYTDYTIMMDEHGMFIWFTSLIYAYISHVIFNGFRYVPHTDRLAELFITNRMYINGDLLNEAHIDKHANEYKQTVVFSEDDVK